MLTIVVPIYNEEEAIPDVIPGLINFTKNHQWQVILVNDGSTDRTPQLLRIFENEENVTIINHKVNRGYGGALKTGLSHVKTPFAITIDGDGQHNLQDVESLFEFAVEKDADLVVGWRKSKQNSGFYRELGKAFIRQFTKFLMPLGIHDLNSGMKLYRTELAQKYIHICPNSMAFSDVITLVFISQRHLVLEFPITIKPRKAGRSTISTSTALETLLEILNIVLMFNPLRIFLPLSLLFIGFSLIWGIPLLIAGRGVSVGTLLLLITGVLLFGLGLIANQLSDLRISLLSMIINQKGSTEKEE